MSSSLEMSRISSISRSFFSNSSRSASRTGAEAEGEVDLCSMFRLGDGLHALRAPDPGLMLRYEEVTCDEASPDAEQARVCKIRNQRSFARRKTLAQMVLDKDEKSTL